MALKFKTIVNKRFAEMKAGANIFYMLADDGAELSGGVSVDLKQCSFEKDGIEVVKPLPDENELFAKLIKCKESKTVDCDGGQKTIKETVYKLEIAGKQFPCPENIANPVINGVGRKIFETNLKVRFTPYEACAGQEGINAAITKISDYGSEVFAK